MCVTPFAALRRRVFDAMQRSAEMVRTTPRTGSVRSTPSSIEGHASELPEPRTSTSCVRSAALPGLGEEGDLLAAAPAVRCDLYESLRRRSLVVSTGRLLGVQGLAGLPLVAIRGGESLTKT